MKKIICLCILAAFCLCVLLPGRVQAVATSGTCGKNTQWYYDEATATLHISGQGPMAFADEPTWSGLADQVQRVVIEEGITSISSHAFDGFSILSDVQIPKSVKRIEDYAFHKCVSLKTIDLHDDIQDIWGCCFMKSGLTEITIPKGVDAVRINTFFACKQLKKVNLHDGITTIGMGAFEECDALEEITIPDSVTEIADHTFAFCDNLRSVHLGTGVQTIAMYAFNACMSLKQIHIPDNVTRLIQNSFMNAGLEKVTIGTGLSNIYEDPFNGCSKLTTIEISEKNPHLYTDKYGAIYFKDTKRFALLPDGFSGTYTVREGTKQIAYCAFAENTKLTGAVLPDSVEEIEAGAFYNCKNLKEVKLSAGLKTIGIQAFQMCENLQTIVFPKGLQQIQSGAFESCWKLTELTFQGPAVDIHEEAFNYIKATVHYPSQFDSWEGKCLNYGGTLTWIAYECKEHIVQTDPAKAPTCTESGLTEGSHCERCGAVLRKQETVSATGHAFGQWELVKEPTAEQTGMEQRTCNVCNKVESRTLEKLQGTTQPTEPTAPPTESTVPPTEPTVPPTDPTAPTQTPTDAPTEPAPAPTQPTEAPSVPTQPETVGKNAGSFWITVVIGIALVAACGAAGFWFGRKRK